VFDEMKESLSVSIHSLINEFLLYCNQFRKKSLEKEIQLGSILFEQFILNNKNPLVLNENYGFEILFNLCKINFENERKRVTIDDNNNFFWESISSILSSNSLLFDCLSYSFKKELNDWDPSGFFSFLISNFF
jgi:hypothetical protein